MHFTPFNKKSKMNFPSMKTIQFPTLLLLAGALISCSAKTEAPNESKVDINTMRVKTEKVFQADTANVVRVIGNLVSQSEAKPSFKIGGIVEKIYFREGDQVRKGQLLAVLDRTEINAQVKQATAAFEKAERDWKRVSNLLADSVATLEQYQNVQTAYQVAGQNLDIAKFNQKYASVYAPVSGQIVRQLLHAGELTGPGNPVCFILGTEKANWKVQLGLDARDWAQVRTGDRAEVILDAWPDKTYQAVVDYRSAVSTNPNGTLDVTLKMIGLEKEPAAGMTARCQIFSSVRSRRTIIPVEALVEIDGEKASVFVIRQDTVQKLELRLHRILGKTAEISFTRDTATEVITLGAAYLREGDPVIKVN
jgi:RND family efflux transporter MFP subunit